MDFTLPRGYSAMRYNLLIDELPQDAGGLQINTSFRVGILLEQLLQDESVSDEQTVDLALGLLFPHGYSNREQAWHVLLWFFRCGKPVSHSGGTQTAHSSKAYDFDEDASLIVAAFQQAYGIDLTTEDLHWWRFRALFDGLPGNCRICKIMGYRTADTTDMPESAKSFYSKMKARYALQSPKARPYTAAERDAALKAKIDEHFRKAEAWIKKEPL